MANIKKLQFFLGALILLSIGCSSDDPKPTAKENLQNALANSSWVIDVANSDITGVSGQPDVATVTVRFFKTEAGATFTFGGDISSLIFGGDFDIASSGSTSNPVLDVDESLVVNEVQINSATSSNFKISFTTGESSGRLTGVGSYTLSFNAN